LTNLVCRNDVVSSTDEGKRPVPKAVSCCDEICETTIVPDELRELFVRVCQISWMASTGKDSGAKCDFGVHH
jgi:hypothetical protein